MFVAREQQLARLGKENKNLAGKIPRGPGAEPLQVTSELIGRRWSTGIVTKLSLGPQRFNRLKLALSGISSKTLSVNLKQLERDGIIQRREVGSRPLRVEYDLTEKGRDFVRVLEAMTSWGQKWHAFQADGGLPPQ